MGRVTRRARWASPTHTPPTLPEGERRVRFEPTGRGVTGLCRVRADFGSRHEHRSAAACHARAREHGRHRVQERRGAQAPRRRRPARRLQAATVPADRVRREPEPPRRVRARSADAVARACPLPPAHRRLPLLLRPHARPEPPAVPDPARDRPKAVFHFVGSDIRGKTPEQLAYARKADARVVGSYDAIRWVPDAEVIPPGVDLSATPLAGTRRRPAARRPRPVAQGEQGHRVRRGRVRAVAGRPRRRARGHHDEAVERYRRADIVVDQLNAGWYGLFAIESMALGKPVVTSSTTRRSPAPRRRSASPFPSRTRRRRPSSTRLRPLVDDAERAAASGAASRAYVEAVHDDERIADRLLALYARL